MIYFKRVVQNIKIIVKTKTKVTGVTEFEGRVDKNLNVKKIKYFTRQCNSIVVKRLKLC